MNAAIDQAEQAIEMIAMASDDVCEAIAVENAAIRARDELRDSLVASLVGTTNALTSKPHSATSAAEAAEKDEAFRYLDDRRKTQEANRIRAWARYEQAKCRAKLAVVAAGGDA